MTDIELAIKAREGQAIRKAFHLIGQIADSEIADMDNYDDSVELEHIKGLIIKAREIREDLPFT